MNFKVGDRVIMSRTQKTGTVSSLLGNDLFQVRLDGGLGYLPAPSHALSLISGDTAPAAPPRTAPIQRDSQHDTGVQLAFDPIFNGDGDPESYQLYLINGTGSKLLYEIKVHTGSTKRAAKFGPLAAYDKLKFELIPYHWLNERLTVDLDVRATVEGGTGPRHFQQLKIKPKQFFSSYREVPELSRGAHVYAIFPKLDARSVADRSSGPSLRELTRAQLKKQQPVPAAPPAENPLLARSEFNDTLDLHLSALVDDPASVPKQEALAVQMRAFDAYMDQALRLDVKQVYVLHGVGDGILKAEVHKRLKHVPFVRKFHNSYHPKYGYGATEVLFES
ncbi:Smr/MutS family protein [Lewinella sp. JB7]|uniref:Smr/MutS family protein n=1 Tax=Lewinella sp. JB7 TaxID=2962887 RepID=UPI0020C97DB1|nr:Smr/MutS family protein [Lewinella sp. JB7]MCP9235362.1 Smr/MutS family protein [Lewinella sp. JB7]